MQTVNDYLPPGNGESTLEAWISLLLAALVLMCGLVMLLGCVQLCERFGNVFTVRSSSNVIYVICDKNLILMMFDNYLTDFINPFNVCII